MVVVLPAPLGPRKPKISPDSTRRLRSMTARVFPNTLVKADVSMAELIDWPCVSLIPRPGLQSLVAIRSPT